MKKKLCILLGILMPLLSFGQIRITGKVSNKETHETLVGAVVIFSNSQAVRTNAQGEYSIEVVKGTYNIKCTMLGYEDYSQEVKLQSNQVLNIKMASKNSQLNIVTISGSRFEKKIEEETVSMEVIKPDRILATGMNAMDDALHRVPGVDVIENQINIRGGAGWSYGAGSRVVVLVDDMPIQTADAQNVRWSFLPIENCTQVEVIKGASSCLYGSSALNGVVNFRTAYAHSKPKTKVMLYNGMYGNPKEKSWKWWGKRQPGYQGGYLSHAQKFGNLDVVLGSAWYSEDSYLEGGLQRRGRVNANIRYRSKKKPGLSYGVKTNLQLVKEQNFFFWEVDTVNDNGYYRPFGGLGDSTTTINKNEGQRINIDPFFTYVKEDGSKHSVRTRWFRNIQDIPEKKQSSVADLYYGEYQYQKPFHRTQGLLKNTTLTTGIIGIYQRIVGELYGDHNGNNYAAYAQVEKKINKLWLSFGVRYEANRIDSFGLESRPVFRLGTNYELNKQTYLRGSFGQGYRYPSVAERFINTQFGASRVFPNLGLKSETGWSAELGLKKLWKSGKWYGYFDVAGFWMEYQDMMEYNFGMYLPADSTIGQVSNPGNYIGFRSNNVGRSRINGIDISTYGQGKFRDVGINYLLAYTYMNPKQVNPDSVVIANLSGDTYTLKYRYNHSVKLDLQAEYKKWTFGTVILYNSFMKNVDEVFENNNDEKNAFAKIFQDGTGLPHTVQAFRKKYDKGTFTIDLRASFELSKKVGIAFIVRNVTNTVYAERPLIISPPRNFTLQLRSEL